MKYKRFYAFLWCFSIPFIFVIIYFTNRLSTYGIANAMRTANWVSKPFFPDHTSYAAVMAMLLPVLGFAMYILRKSKNIFKLFYLIVFVIFLFGLITSYTRAAWFSLIIACGFIIPHLLKIKLKYSLLTIFTIILGLWISWTQIQLHLIQNHQQSSSNIFKHIQSVTNVSSDVSNLERINRWNSAIRMFKEKPIFGFGPRTYQFKYAPFQATKDRTLFSTNFGDRGNAHSEYLGPLAESGILGLLSFLGIVLTSLFTASRVYFTSNKKKIKYLALALMIGLLSYDIHGIMNNFLDLDKLNCLFWGFTAMIVALDIYHNKTKEEKRSVFYY
jgi:O-antigen ligase